MLQNSASVFGALEDLLERENTLIKSGKIEQLARLLPEKERLLVELGSTQESAVQLQRLRQKAEHNGDLLSAVSRGIRSVRQRLEALKNSQNELRTYTQEGRSQNLSRGKSNFERKA